MAKFKWFILSIFFLIILSGVAEAGIVLKVIAVNPSKTGKQTVQVKAYLPKEVKPEDIIDKSDLEIAYDNQQGSYYVYGEYELNPGELMEKEIEMRDIWFISAAEIESLRLEADKSSRLLENTAFRERVNFLLESIESKLKGIEESQRLPSVNPEKHISKYRDNAKLLEAVKEDLVIMRSLLVQAKPLPPASVWRLILLIVIFLGVIGVGSYFLWRSQIKVIATPTFGTQGTQEAPLPKAEKIEAKKEKKAGAEDIEKIIKGE